MPGFFPSKKWKALTIAVATLLSIVVLYLCGPRPRAIALDHSWPAGDDDISAEQLAAANDAGLRLRPDQHSRIVWLDEKNRGRTRLAMLYLHGFSASWFEGEPLHRDLCRATGMNLYLPRLAEHGLDSPDPLGKLRPDDYYRSALQALALTGKLGDRVVIAGTSTGASLALMLAADFPDRVAGLLLFSPNIRLADAKARLLTRPWGLQLARLILGSRYRDTGEQHDELVQRYWYRRYRLEGVQAIQQLTERFMQPETFARVRCPALVAYFPGDRVVSAPAIADMFEHLGTPPQMKKLIAFPRAGRHVIVNRHLCPDFEAVYRAALEFLSSHFHFGYAQ